jgi:hypothetical protein
MQKFAFFILTLALFACGQKDEKKVNTVQPSSGLQQTEISFTEQLYNFGELEAGEIVLHSFVFTNTGTNNFVIERLHSDCECVKASYSKQAVKPGEKGIIEVEFDTAGLVGKEYKTIEVHGNSKELKHLAIFAVVKNELLEIKY